MAKPNPFAGKKAPPFGGGGKSKPNPFARKPSRGEEKAEGEAPSFFKKGGKVRGK